MSVKPSVAVASACPPLWAAPLSGVPAIASWSAVTGTSAVWTAALARPKSRVEATGVGYAAPAAAGARRGADRPGRDVPGGTAVETRFIGTNGSNGKQQDQLHLMSRRDPRTWRPPA
jgi:hypothetical protein